MVHPFQRTEQTPCEFLYYNCAGYPSCRPTEAISLVFLRSASPVWRTGKVPCAQEMRSIAWQVVHKWTYELNR
jgi:hypothetical protein